MSYFLGLWGNPGRDREEGEPFALGRECREVGDSLPSYTSQGSASRNPLGTLCAVVLMELKKVELRGRSEVLPVARSFFSALTWNTVCAAHQQMQSKEQRSQPNAEAGKCSFIPLTCHQGKSIIVTKTAAICLNPSLTFLVDCFGHLRSSSTLKLCHRVLGRSSSTWQLEPCPY